MALYEVTVRFMKVPAGDADEALDRVWAKVGQACRGTYPVVEARRVVPHGDERRVRCFGEDGSRCAWLEEYYEAEGE